ncbi:hypothetical protein [Ehrlichia ruminantium]|nr:hypothetical protein [Ehrlichia ruminantium]
MEWNEYVIMGVIVLSIIIIALLLCIFKCIYKALSHKRQISDKSDISSCVGVAWDKKVDSDIQYLIAGLPYTTLDAQLSEEGQINPLADVPESEKVGSEIEHLPEGVPSTQLNSIVGMPVLDGYDKSLCKIRGMKLRFSINAYLLTSMRSALLSLCSKSKLEGTDTLQEIVSSLKLLSVKLNNWRWHLELDSKLAIEPLLNFEHSFYYETRALVNKAYHTVSRDNDNTHMFKTCLNLLSTIDKRCADMDQQIVAVIKGLQGPSSGISQ